MKRVDQALRKELPPLIVWTEELTELETLLRENCEELVIQSGAMQYDSVSELIQNVGQKVLNELEITTRVPRLRIKLDRMGGQVFGNSSGILVTGLVTKCFEILTRHSRVRKFLGSFKTLITFGILHLVLTSPRVSSPPASHLFMAAYLSYSLSFFSIYARRCKINLWPSDSFTAFWLRNRDNLIVGAITGILGFVLGFLCERLVR